MPEYLSPGVYIEEVNKGTRPIEGVGTAMAAFVGFAPAGPSNTPVLVTNWSQYVEKFGAGENGGRRNPHLEDAYLSHAVYGYFNNGGGRCYVVRVNPDDVAVTADGPAKLASAASRPTLQLPSRTTDALPSISVTSKGTQQADVQIEIAPATADDAGEGAFTFKAKSGDVDETFENVSLARKGPRYVVETVNQQSRLLQLAELKTQGSVSERAPALGVYTLTLPGSSPLTTTAVASLPAKVKSTHFIGDASQRSGLEGFEIAEDVTMVSCPDLMSAFQKGIIDADGVKAVQLGMISHCERMKNRLAILDPLPGLSPQQVKKWREKDTNYDSAFAATYYPWIKVDGPDGKPIEVPPSGHIAGIFARSDNERGVHKAPANEVIRGALGRDAGDEGRAGHAQSDWRQLHPLVHRPRCPRVGRSHAEQRSRVAVHQRSAPVQLRREVDRNRHPVGGVRAE